MIRFSGRGKDGRPVVGLGLSHENLARLCADEPIVVDTQDLNVEGGPLVVVFVGRTEEEITDRLVAAGAVGPNTITYTEGR